MVSVARRREAHSRRADDGHDAEEERDSYEEGVDAEHEDGDEYEDEYDGDEEPQDDRSSDQGRPHRRPARRMSAANAAEAGLRHLGELTSKQATGITSVEGSEDGWVIGIEVVEDKRVPSSADVLAVYEAEIDDKGELVAYRRLKRYSSTRRVAL